MHHKTLVAVLAGVAVGIGLVLGLAAIDEGRPRGAPRTRPGLQRRHPRPVGEVAIAAAYLGMERAQLRAALRGGKTLGEIADGVPGRSARGLIAVIFSERARKLADRLRAGTVTPAQARRQLAHLRERVSFFVLDHPLGGAAAGG